MLALLMLPTFGYAHTSTCTEVQSSYQNAGCCEDVTSTVSLSTLTDPTEYDYIVIGSGGGAVTAATLASSLPDKSVLLLEAGNWDSNEMYQPGFDWTGFTNQEFWNEKGFYVKVNGMYAWTNAKNDYPDLKATYRQAKNMGGSIYTNNNRYIRGSYAVYSDNGRFTNWTDDFIDKAFRTWDRPDVTKLFDSDGTPLPILTDKNLLAKKGAFESADGIAHGRAYNGAPTLFDPILGNSLMQAFVDAASTRGIPFHQNGHSTNNAHGFNAKQWFQISEPASNAASGTTVKSSSYRSMAAAFNGTNLYVKPLSYVDKIHFTENADEQLTATSVEVFDLLPNNTIGRPDHTFLHMMDWGFYDTIPPYDASLPQYTTKTQYKARKEVIIAGGYANTPGVLLRSGIGDAEQLSTMGVDMKIENNHVGKHYRDHSMINMWGFQDLTFGDGTATIQAFDNWKAGTGQSLYNITDPAEVAASCAEGESWCTRCVGGRPRAGSFSTPSQDNHLFFNGTKSGNVVGRSGQTEGLFLHHSSVCTLLGFGGGWFSIGPGFTEGTIEPNADPLLGPSFDYTFYENERDCFLVRDLITELVHIVNSTSFRNSEYAPFADLLETKSPFNEIHESDEFWLAKCDGDKVFGGYHGVGTARMGTTKNDGVVDQTMKVFGTTNVRVGDLSVLTQATTGNAGGPAQMLGGAAALFALAAAL